MAFWAEDELHDFDLLYETSGSTAALTHQGRRRKQRKRKRSMPLIRHEVKVKIRVWTTTVLYIYGTKYEW